MSQSTQSRILDAAFECVSEAGLARLTLEDVASRAGVARQTLYRHFVSRDGLLRALVLREEQWFIDRVLAAAAPHADLETAVAAGVAAALEAAGEHPLLQRLLRDEPGEILPLVVLGRGPVISAARPVVAGILAERLDTHPVEIEELADTCTRLLVSHVLDPGPDEPEIVGRRIAKLIVVSRSSRAGS